ncbi:MAG: spore coat protein [Sporomusaceae bacterium]|nr:spore coat protein [Sporomusaceae bacterium]
MPLSQKEKQLLQDQKSHEEVCIKKYQAYANQATDPQLQQLFQSFAQKEQTHLQTINSLLQGQTPAMNQTSASNSAQNQSSSASSGQATSSSQSGTSNSQASTTSSKASTTSQNTSTATTASKEDATLCSDMLMTEKYVSGAYNTAIFEFTDPQIRQTLNHIQKEEQEHGEGLFQYMNSHNMYQVQ